ncbi:50S ribosomal protein L31 [bacterium]|jgi:large subunit ribosomal protein L31|nr:50S ribosomal protein L31 [bacterium]NBX72440.1 50S ribosomal protein L31 [bacterium]
MKKSIHPHYPDLNVSCTCGNKFTTRSTYKKAAELKLEICGECHPFYTGKQKTVDTDRRIDKFFNKYGKKTSNVTDVA